MTQDGQFDDRGAGSQHDRLMEDPEIGWLFRSLGKIGGAIICVGALVLLPVSFWLAETNLNLEGLAGKRRIAVSFLCWAMLMMIVLGPIVLALKLPVIAKFVLGPKEHRHRWVALQVCAWVMTVAYTAIGVTYWMGESWEKPLGEALGMHSISAGLAFAGLYIGAMGFMPAEFFETDRMGRAMKGFVGSETSGGVPLRCIGGAVAFAALSGGLWWLCAATFSN